jgi:hypothetical protein
MIEMLGGRKKRRIETRRSDVADLGRGGVAAVRDCDEG